MYEKSMSGSHWGHWGTTLIVVSYFLNRKKKLCVHLYSFYRHKTLNRSISIISKRYVKFNNNFKNCLKFNNNNFKKSSKI